MGNASARSVRQQGNGCLAACSCLTPWHGELAPIGTSLALASPHAAAASPVVPSPLLSLAKCLAMDGLTTPRGQHTW